MKAAIFAYSRQGCRTAQRVAHALAADQLRLYTLERLEMPEFLSIPKPSKEFYGDVFKKMDALIFVSSCGIAVREIAPFVSDKTTDPAVLVLDELGKFVIPLLSGHIGGANELAGMLAERLGAVPVVTTATDVNGKFSVDAWAARNGYCIDSMRAAKAVSAAILEQDIPLYTDLSVVSPYPAGVVPGREGSIGIYVGCRTWKPFANTLTLIPPMLHLGIGCRRGTSEAEIEEALTKVLSQYRIDRRAIVCAASIDLKQEEAGLLSFCRHNHWPVRFYSAKVLGALQGAFTPSAFVSQITGVDNVCERAAMMGARQLIVRKTAHNGVTIALAAEHKEVNFG